MKFHCLMPVRDEADIIGQSPRQATQDLAAASLERLPWLDGLRAMAALMVMVFHFVGHHGESPRWAQAAVIGQTGVDLFFVLSGFLITRILIRCKGSAHFFSAFYIRRALRIFPLYYGFLLFYFFLLPLMLGEKIAPFATQWWAWFYLQNLPPTFPGLVSSGPGHFWSLAVEEHFYLLWPLLVYALGRRGFSWVLGMILVGPLLLRVLFVTHGLEVFYFTFTRVDALGFGALLALWVTAPGFDPQRTVALFRVLMAVFPAILLPMFILLSGSRLAWLQAGKSSLIPAFYMALIGFCLFDPWARSLRDVFQWRWLRSLGTISYGLYVFHPVCFMLVEHFWAPRGVLFSGVLCFGSTIATAWLCFRFFETPILRLKRHFRYETKTRQALPTA